MQLPTAARPIRAEATPPPSKSITHRALIAAALCTAPTRVENPLDAEDAHLTASALERLGCPIRRSGGIWEVHGFAGGRPEGEAGEEVRVPVGNSGSSLRLLLPLAALGERSVIFDGTPRLRQRPVGSLMAALEQLGAVGDHEGETGFPPVRIHGPLAGGRCRLDAAQSSQFLSGLLLAAPAATRADTRIQVTALSSRPYVDLTRAVAARFGVRIEEKGDVFHVRRQSYASPGTFTVEADASAAAFLLAAGVITSGRVTVNGVGRESLQGDRAFADYLAQMGCDVEWEARRVTASGLPRTGITADLNAHPDLVPPLVAVALFAPSPSRLTGIAHLRLKESDRIAALVEETTRLGATTEAGEDFIAIQPAPLSGARVAARDDHRIAMALAVTALGVPGMTLDDPGCVAKSYPGFFTDLARLLGTG